MLHLVLPMPPSDNRIYVNLPRGGRKLSAEAERFKKDVFAIVSDTALASEHVTLDQDATYMVRLDVFFKAIENKGWPKKAKRRYKKVDLHNRQKLLIDAVTDALGVDDSCIFRVELVKDCDPERPRIEVALQRYTWV